MNRFIYSIKPSPRPEFYRGLVLRRKEKTKWDNEIQIKLDGPFEGGWNWTDHYDSDIKAHGWLSEQELRRDYE